MSYYYIPHTEGGAPFPGGSEVKKPSSPVPGYPPPMLAHPTPETSSGPRLYPTLETSSYSTRPPPLTSTAQQYLGQYATLEITRFPISDRPSSIAELAELSKRALQIDWDPNSELKQNLRKAEKHRREGNECVKGGDLETAFVHFATGATLVLEKLPQHRGYYTGLNANQRHNLSLNGQDILDRLADIKPVLIDRYDKWLVQQHSEDVDTRKRHSIITNEPSASTSNDRDRYDAPQYGLIDSTKTHAIPSSKTNANELYGWGGIGEIYNDERRLTPPMTEFPANPSVVEHIDRPWSLPKSANSSFSTTISSIKTEDLTGSVKRESEYPAHGGGYADVYTGTLTRKARTIKVAIKVIRSHTYAASNQWKIDKRLRREILLWSCLRHPNIVPLLGTTTGFGAYPAMVGPWMKDGDLSHYLSIKKRELSLRRRLQILADVVEGLAYLHSQSVIHGDLTTGNILMDEGKAHLSDFGLSNVMIEVRNMSFMSSTVSGSPRWTAPELLHVGAGVPDVTKHCDIYSFGSVVLQTITGRIPYESITLDVQVLMEVMRGGTPARPPEPLFSDELWDLTVSCWSRDPTSRPEIGQVREKLHILRYNCSEGELATNIVDSDKSLEEDEDDDAEPYTFVSG